MEVTACFLWLAKHKYTLPIFIITWILIHFASGLHTAAKHL